VKIGFKFQSLGKISNNSTADPPVLLGHFQHWGHCPLAPLNPPMTLFSHQQIHRLEKRLLL